MMVQGRAGAGWGAAFNLGEVTVTRASVRLGCGTVGHALVQGLDARKAERAALLDALLQTSAHNDLAVRGSDALARRPRRRRKRRAQNGPPPPRSISLPWFGGKRDG